MKINPLRLGLAFGLLLALFHAAWALLVATGWAQPLMNFIFWAHFITPPYHIEAFETGRAAILLAFVFGAGLLLGVIGGYLWNRLARARELTRPGWR